ncbi:MAG TPA: hypothetical protein VJX92_19565, partial [Methylomirabilota bacterium]|nr:hypothetical protein [Methylomirabilota bacterium]
MKADIPAYLESLPSAQPASSPVTTRHQELPFGELTWENFERLCLRVARREAEIHQCFLYGNPGQAQRGIDFIGYAGDVRNREMRVYQCKREETLGPAKIIEAVDAFLSGQWEPLPRHFVLCAKTRLRTTQVQDEIGRQIERLAERGIIFELWDSEILSERLKNMPDLVDDFFGRGWVEAFNGRTSVASFGVRLSGPEIGRLRSRLFDLYSTLFDRHDPGLPGQLVGRVPYRERYVSPGVSEHRAAIHAAPPEISGEDPEHVVRSQAGAHASAFAPELRRE